ncbi:MAG: GerMN domain-containing protein, partial [Eubacteriales bacterium]|nr:GerMN domain-containing protein [Eubacteriales bacterium]
ILFNGQKVAKLPNGTAVDEVYTKALVNAQPKGVPTTADGKVQLYYTNAQGQVLVPVYQALETNTPAAALAQMLKPDADGGLSSLLPDGCKILSVTVESDGTAKVDLSKDFEALSDTPSIQTMAIKAILLTCRQFDGVEDVDVLVEGQPLEANVATMAGLDSGALNTYD